jgi:hypothetical protein
MSRKRVFRYTVLLTLIIAFSCFVIGKYYRMEYVVDYFRPIRGVSTTLPRYPKDEWDPWLKPYFDDSVWHYEDLRCWISCSTKKPGAKIGYSYKILGEYEKQNLTIVSRLIKLGTHPQILENKTEYRYGPPFSCNWEVYLPEDSPAEYRFGLVVYDSEGRILDGSISSITVPVQELRASMRVEPPMVTEETTINLVIENEGSSTLNYGTMYSIEKYVNGTWVHAPNRCVWTAIMLIHEPGVTRSYKMEVEGLDSGNYRVKKEVEAEGTDLEEVLLAGFTVERPFEPDTGEPPRFGFRYTTMFADESMESPDRPMLMVTNLGARKLYFTGYRLIRYEKGEAVDVYVNDTDSVTEVAWGETFKLKVGEPPLTSGQYELVVEFGVEHTSFRETLRKEFHR